MSGSPRAYFQAFPIPTAPLVDEKTGAPTPAWYRFFVALVQRTGGTTGRVTPEHEDQLADLQGLLGQDTIRQGVLPLGLGDSWGKVTGGDSVGLFPGPWDAPTGGYFPPAIPATTPDYPPSYPPPTDAPGGVFNPPPLLSSPSNPASPEAITLGASPYTFTPAAAGQALLSGGTVSSVTWTRDGSTFYATGMTAGFFPLEVTDSLVITYSSLPMLTFLRGPK